MLVIIINFGESQSTWSTTKEISICTTSVELKCVQQSFMMCWFHKWKKYAHIQGERIWYFIFHLQKKSSYESKSPRPKLDSKLSFQVPHSNNIPCTNKTQFAHEQIGFHVKPKDIPINQSFY